MERGLLLDIVVRQRPAVLQLLAREDQPLLVRRDALLVLDLGLDFLDGFDALDLQRDRLARQQLDEDLHGRYYWGRAEFLAATPVLLRWSSNQGPDQLQWCQLDGAARRPITAQYSRCKRHARV